MNTDYADAVNRLIEEVSAAAWRASEEGGLLDREIAAELRRLADEIETDGGFR